jgi:hypothetical protein
MRIISRTFQHKRQDVTVPDRKTVHEIKKYIRTVVIVGGDSEREMLIEEKLDEIGAKCEHFLLKSYRHLAQETQVYSLSSAEFPKRHLST